MEFRLSSILLLFTFVFEFIFSADTCPRFKCDSAMKECGLLAVNPVYGRNVTLNGCSNDTFACPISVIEIFTSKDNLNKTCVEKTVPPRNRYALIL